MTNFSSSSPPLNFKSIGDDFETLGTEVKLDNATFDAARFTGYVKLNAGGSFSLTSTAGSNTSTLSSATDVFENGFIEKSMTPTGEQMTDGGYIIFESGFDKKEIAKIKEIGHKVVNQNEIWKRYIK